MKLNGIKQPPFLIAAGVIGLVCLVQLLHHDFIERLERITYDWRVRQAIKFNRSAVTATNLGFVEITDQSIATINNGSIGFLYGLYWPRHIYGRLARELRREGAQVEAFDILFAGLRPDHATVPLPNGSEISSDGYFARQIREAGNVVIAADNGVLPEKLFQTNALAMGDISAEHDADGTIRRARAFRTYRKWHRAFQQLEDDPAIGVDLQGAIIRLHEIDLPRPLEEDPKQRLIRIPLDKNGNFDLADFVGSRIPPGMKRFDKPFTEERVWNMGIIMAAQALKLDLANAKIELDKGRITLNGPNGVRRVIPVDADGTFYVNWRITVKDRQWLTAEPIEALLARDQAHQTGDTKRFADYMEGKDWRNKLVMIGSTATGNDLTDRGATPLEKNTFLISEHWNVANSLLTGQFVRKSPMVVDLLLIIGIGAAVAALTWKCRSWAASLWVLGVMVGYTMFADFLYVEFRLWVPLVLPLVGGALMLHVSLQSYLVIFEQAERRRVRSVFNKVMAPDVVAELLNSEKLSLTGARRKVTIFFCDIRGFTELTDVSREEAADYIRYRNLSGDAAESVFDHQAREMLDTVNLYLKVIADVVRKNGGTVDKFIGDCVMAFWGAPMPNQQHAVCCVRAAIEVQRAIHRLNQEREAENRQREAQNLMFAAEGRPLRKMLPVMDVGTGINTGVVTVGLMGSDEQLNYTVFGREVNLASRLETISGHARILISEATLAEIIQDDATLALSCKALTPVKIKGIRELVPIYEVPWREDGTTDGTTPAPSASAEYNTGYFTAGERTVE